MADPVKERPMADTSITTEGPASEQPRYLQRVSLRTTLFVAAVFNGVLGVTFALVGYVVLYVAVQRGALDQINKTLADLSNDHPLHVSATRLGVVWTLIVLAWTIAMTIVAFLAAVVFNTVLRISGGVELDLSDARGKAFDMTAPAGLARRSAVLSARWTAVAAHMTKQRTAAAARTTTAWAAAAARRTTAWVAAAAFTTAVWTAAAARTTARWTVVAARTTRSRVRVPELHLDTGAAVIGSDPRPMRRPPQPNVRRDYTDDELAANASDPAPRRRRSAATGARSDPR
jgi:hypothetical protein